MAPILKEIENAVRVSVKILKAFMVLNASGSLAGGGGGGGWGTS